MFNLAVVCALSDTDFVAFALPTGWQAPDLTACKYDALRLNNNPGKPPDCLDSQEFLPQPHPALQVHLRVSGIGLEQILRYRARHHKELGV